MIVKLENKSHKAPLGVCHACILCTENCVFHIYFKKPDQELRKTHYLLECAVLKGSNCDSIFRCNFSGKIFSSCRRIICFVLFETSFIKIFSCDGF